MCIPKSNHKKLINECYPPAKALATCGPEYRPNSNELSRLAYYANNKPAKLTKVGNVLEARASADSRAVRAGAGANEKAKAGLMVTLAITKNLVSECKRDLNYFSKSAQAVVNSALQCAATGGAGGRRDLELSARAASTFYALATFTDPATASIDAELGQTYQTLLVQFARMAMESPASHGADAEKEAGGELKDREIRNRTRLIGLGALSGAVGSDVLFTANFVQQAAVIVPALLDNMKGNRVTMDFLRTKSKKASDGTPTFAEFAIKKRPAHMRRAPSISEHVDGEKGPSSEDVASAAVGTFQGLMRHGDATQVQATLAPVLAWLDGRDTSGSLPTPSRSQWDNVEWCSWLAETMASWAALQYRFVVLTALVEHLVDTCEGPGLGKHATLVAMVTTILMGQTSLIGLSTSDTLNNLLGLIVRRVHIDSRDSLLPPLVECVSGLGVHVYYADQINDIADEITARIVALQVPESSSQSSASASQVAKAVAKSTPEQRDESIRVLLVCLSGVMAAAKRSSGEVQKAVDEGTSMATVEKGKATAAEGDATLGLARAGTRNRISSEVWHHTASLLAHPNHTVRLAYEQALLTFLVDEVDRGSVATDLISAGVGPSLSNDATGLTHAFSAGAHVLALSKNLAVHTSVRESPLEVLPSIDRANAEESIAAPSDLSSAALPVDYSGLSALFDALYESLPVPALLGTVPMLLALDRNAGKQLLPAAKDRGSADAQRRLATRAVVAKAFIKIADVWNVPALRSVAENTLSQIPALSLPELAPAQTSLTIPHDPLPFPELPRVGESSAAGSPSIDPRRILDALASSVKIQAATSLDPQTLRKWFQRDWSVQIAVDDSFVGASPYGASSSSSENEDLLKFTSATGSQAARDNVSSTSFTQSGISPCDREAQVGVEDFRQALGAGLYVHTNGRSGGSTGSNASQDGTSPTTTKAERHASRRASRKVNAPAGGAAGVGGLLDSMRVGMSEANEPIEAHRPNVLVPPYQA